MCRRGGCCCYYSLKCRTDAIRHSGVNLIVFGCILTLVGITIRIFLTDFIFNFGYALIWAGVSAFVTGIGSLSIARTMKFTDEDCGFRGLIFLCLVCIICVGGAVGLITWQMWEADYFQEFEEDTIFKSDNQTVQFMEWFVSMFAYGLVDLAALLIIGSTFVTLLISCCCPESSDELTRGSSRDHVIVDRQQLCAASCLVPSVWGGRHILSRSHLAPGPAINRPQPMDVMSEAVSEPLSSKTRRGSSS